MCIAFFTTTQPGFKLIIASNRDEFYDRPATPAAWHTFGRDSPEGSREFLSGQDLAAAGGGTWLGMTKDLRIGLITNIRDPSISPAAAAIRRPGAPSRGQLLRGFLEAPPSSDPIRAFMDATSNSADYDGFNLLLFHVKQDGAEVGHVSNRPEVRAEILDDKSRGAHGISNTPIEKPWPKVVDGEKGMGETLAEWGKAGEGEDELVQRLFRLLRRSTEIKSIADAPQCTCIPPVILSDSWYGTRVSTVILVSDKDEVTFVERDIGGLVDGEGTFLKSDNRVFRF